MRQYHVINFMGIKAKVFIHIFGVLTKALEHAAVQQNAGSVIQSYQMLAAGYVAGGAVKGYIHLQTFLKMQDEKYIFQNTCETNTVVLTLALGVTEPKINNNIIILFIFIY